MDYKNYLFDLYATLVDIHTNQNTANLWRRTAALMNSYGAVYESRELRNRYRMLIRANEASLSEELHTDYPEIEIGDVFKELILDAPVYHREGIWGDPRGWNGETLERWCGSFAYAFRVMSRIRFALYPDTIRLLERLKREGKHVYLLSNAQSLFTRPEMSELGLTHYFEDIFISSEHRMRKPEPRFMREMLDKHGLDVRETVMVGNDIKSDIMIAAACGVSGILVDHDGYSESEIKEGFDRARGMVPDCAKEEVQFTAYKDLRSVISDPAERVAD